MLNRRWAHAIGLLLLCVIATIVVRGAFRGHTPSKEEPKIVKIKHRIPSINKFITNDLSDYEQTRKFDKDIESFIRRWELKGASFALMRNDSLIYAKGYGYADVEGGVKCEANHLFRVASVSKLLTATAIMKLVEDKKLTLSSQVFGEEGILCDTMFLNLRNPNLKRITVEHLLRHTAGFSSPHGDPAFANYNVARYLDRELPLSVDDMVVYATRNRLRYQPGGNFDYSNLGYIILGKIIEKVSGQGYEEYVQKSILHPVGCYDMFVGRSFERNRAPQEVHYYEVKEADEVEAHDGSGVMCMKSSGGNNIALLGSAGGWVSSSVEMLKFVASIDDCPLRKSILSSESIEIMTTTTRQKRAIGWASTSKYGWLRSGSMAGTSALIKKQSDGYTWVFIANSSAWIGPNISKYISSRITRAISRVEEWPERDMFDISKGK